MRGARITGVDKHVNRLKRAAQRTPDAVLRELYVAGQEIEIAAEISITQGSISGKGHIPSRPGEPPNADTRDLDTKIETRIVRRGDNPRVDVEAFSAHAVFMEFGTSRVAERPFMRPAAAKKRGNVRASVSRAVSSTLK